MRNAMFRFFRLAALAALVVGHPAQASERVAIPGGIIVETGKNLQVVADSASAVTYSIFGAEFLSSAEIPKKLASGFVPTTVTPVYTPTAPMSAVVTLVVLANTSGASVTGIKLFHNGGTAVSQILGELELCGHCTATLANDGWRIISASGELLTLGGGGGGGASYFAGTCLDLTGTTFNFNPSTDCSFNGHKVTGVAPGTGPNDVVNLLQLSAAVEGRHSKDAVNWCTTGNISLSGLGTQANGEWTGTLSGTERIVVRLQTTSADDGIFMPASGAWTRTADGDSGSDITSASVLVKAGASCIGDTYTQSNPVTTIGVDPQFWAQTGDGATNTGDGTTITLTGNQFSRSAITGDVSCPAGSATCTLPNVVTAGSSTKPTFNAKGQVTGNGTAQLASSDFANQGTINTLLHGNAVGNTAFGPVTLSDQAASMPNGTSLCRTTAGTGIPEYCTGAQETALLSTATNSVKGLMAAADKGKLDALGSLQLNASGGSPLASCRGNATTGITETFLCGMTIPTTYPIAAGQMFRILVLLQSSSTGTFTGRLRAGAAGTVADTQLSLTVASAAGVANSWVFLDGLVYVAATGASSTIGGTLRGSTSNATTTSQFSPAAAAEVLSNTNTAAQWFITVSGTASSGTYTIRALRAIPL